MVVPVTTLDQIDVNRLGRRLRSHHQFSPHGTNVNFIQADPKHPNRLRIRTYERGVEEETLACGTGIVASALIFAASENGSSPITVLARGGDGLEVGFEKVEGGFRNVTLTGPAEFVFEGTIEI